jgi:hypothetical protein
VPANRKPKISRRERRQAKRREQALRTGDSPEKKAEPARRGAQPSAADGASRASIGGVVNGM